MGVEPGTVVLTGVAGQVGRAVRVGLRGVAARAVLADLVETDSQGLGERSVVLDVPDREAVVAGRSVRTLRTPQCARASAYLRFRLRWPGHLTSGLALGGWGATPPVSFSMVGVPRLRSRFGWPGTSPPASPSVAEVLRLRSRRRWLGHQHHRSHLLWSGRHTRLRFRGCDTRLRLPSSCRSVFPLSRLVRLASSRQRFSPFLPCPTPHPRRPNSRTESP